MTARVVAVVGRPASLISCVLEGVGRRGHRTSLDPFGRPHHDQHGEVLAILGGGPPVAVGVWCPYALSHFAPEDVWVLAPRSGTGWAARLSDHPAWEKWRGKMDPGEFWASAGESWIFELEAATTKIDAAIAAALAGGGS